MRAGSCRRLSGASRHSSCPTITPEADIEALAAAGHRSLKTATLFLDQRGADLVAAVALAGRLGMLTMIHCEDGALIDHATAALVADEHAAASSTIR